MKVEKRGQASNGGNPSHHAGNETPIYLTTDSTLQTEEEHAKDQQTDPRKDTTMEASNDDLHPINAGKLTEEEGNNDNNP